MRKRKRKPAKAALEFNHAMVYVRRVAPALRFYRNLLGFKLIEQHQWRGLPVYARLRSPRGHTTLALHVREPGQRLPKTEGIRLYFECQDLARVCRRLASAAVKFLQKPKLMP